MTFDPIRAMELIQKDAERERKQAIAAAMANPAPQPRRSASLSSQDAATECQTPPEVRPRAPTHPRGPASHSASGDPEADHMETQEDPASNPTDDQPNAETTGLEEAQKRLETLLGKLKTDPGAVFAPDALRALVHLRRTDPLAWGKMKTALQKSRIPIRDLHRAMASVAPSPRLCVADPEEKPEPRTAGEMLRDAPYPELIIPAPYYVAKNATIQAVIRHSGLPELETREEQKIAHSPILITERLIDIVDDKHYLQLAWRRPGGWCHRIVERGVALDSRKLITLADHGFPVASDNLKALVRYLHDLEAANIASLPTARVSPHLGWQGDAGKHGFLCGRTLVLPGGELAPLSTASQHHGGRGNSLSFRGLTPGDEQIADGYHQRGSFSDWVKAVKVLKNHPRALVALYTSFVPPMLTILGCPNFIVDWFHRTSVGKTSCLRVAASVWGNPNENQPNPVVRSWDSTQVYLERASSILSDLPLILDETKRVKDHRFVAKFLYEIAHGQGRGRGNVTSTALTRTWRTVALSTGEAPIISFTKDGGTKGRCLEIRGGPFGTPSPESAGMVHDLDLAVRDNYGHAGIGFVQYLLRHRNRWERLEEDYRATVEHYTNSAPKGADPAVASRLAQYTLTRPSTCHGNSKTHSTSCGLS